MSQIQITQDMLNQFNEDGYMKIPSPLFEEKDFQHLKRYLMAFCLAVPENLRHRHFTNVKKLKPRFADWIGSPPVINLVEQILGPDIAFWSFGMCYKPANSPYRVPAHIDSHYWIDWNLLNPNEVLGIFIPFTDVSAKNGCLKVLPKINDPKIYLHKDVDPDLNFFKKEIDDPAIDLSKLVDVEMKANEVCLLRENLIHSSECNNSPFPRLGITLRYISAKTKYNSHESDDHDIFLIKGNNVAGNAYKDLSAFEPLGGFSWSK